VAKAGKLPVPMFAAGGVATPSDAALCMALGAETVFVGSGIFKSGDPERLANAIVEAVANWKDPKVIARVSRGLGEAMKGLDVRTLKTEERFAERGW
jgi:pyridoxal 5'-phosphate synthase pdxS subunit